MRNSALEGSETTYKLTYAGKKIDRIEQTDKSGMNKSAKVRLWQFVRYTDSTWVMVDKDITLRLYYDAQGRLIKAKRKAGFVREMCYFYDAQGRLDSLRENGDPVSVYQKYFYGAGQEITFRYRDGQNMSYKGAITLDDKRNPFYPHLDLYVALDDLIPYSFTPNNATQVYFLTLSSKQVIENKYVLHYNAQGYPAYLRRENSTEEYFEYECE